MPGLLPILIVDDSPITRTGLSLSLTHFGFHCKQAETGLAALTVLNADDFEYSAVLMDYYMPDMTGATCTKAIRRLETATDRRLPILGITTDDNPKIKRLCLNSGMDQVLIKGFPTSLLIDTLNQLLLQNCHHK